MATAVSTKPVAESKKAPTSTPAPIAAPEMTTIVAEPDFQRDTFDEKLLGDLNGGALDNGLDNNDFSNLNENGNNPQKISELPRKQKKMIREKRFGSDAYSGLDTNQLVATMEAEKLKRQERAQKFGLGDTEEVQADKRKERMARFKAEQ